MPTPPRTRKALPTAWPGRLLVVLGALGTVVTVLTLAGCRSESSDSTIVIDHGNHVLPATEEPVGTQRSWTMPAVTGLTLRQAQDRVRQRTDGALVSIRTHDATGQGRHPLAGARWRVCSQDIPSGTHLVRRQKIDLGVVQLTEYCP
ncbi:hypothetical protein [Amycolatopsis pigmentata]|uniref:PASTA domain-containing protein n=1 Tax=Amycolatopsis pigmentata TaxID=450801 RepID=A0ABW5FNX4_9PSEU